MSASIENIWKQIEAWLQANAPEVLAKLLPGATPKDIEAAEHALKTKFPAEMTPSYLIHDGQDDFAAPVMGEWELLSLQNMEKAWKTNSQLLETGGLGKNRGDPVGPVRPVFWDPQWIPVARDGAGDLVCVDMHPAEGGKSGQIINFWHADTKREVIAGSYGAWLDQFAQDLKAGKYRLEDDGLVRRDGGKS